MHTSIAALVAHACMQSDPCEQPSPHQEESATSTSCSPLLTATPPPWWDSAWHGQWLGPEGRDMGIIPGSLECILWGTGNREWAPLWPLVQHTQGKCPPCGTMVGPRNKRAWGEGGTNFSLFPVSSEEPHSSTCLLLALLPLHPIVQPALPGFPL